MESPNKSSGFRILPVILLLLELVACSSPEQTSAPESPPAQAIAEPRLRIRRIPFRNVKISGVARTLPLKPMGLRFQMGGSPAARLKPLGDGKFGPFGELYLSFPRQGLLVVFAAHSFESSYWGQPALGGKGEIVKDPERLFLWDEEVYHTNTGNGQVLVLNRDGSFHDTMRLPVPAPLCGPHMQFLLAVEEVPDRFVRVDRQGSPLRRYQLPEEPDQSPAARRMHFRILADWTVIAAQTNGSRIYRIEADGKIAFQIRLELPGGNFGVGERPASSTDLSVKEVFFENGDYWLLLNQATPELAFLLVINEAGEGDRFWRLPEVADGFDLNKTWLLLMNKQQGTAMTYRRP